MSHRDSLPARQSSGHSPELEDAGTGRPPAAGHVPCSHHLDLRMEGMKEIQVFFTESHYETFRRSALYVGDMTSWFVFPILAFCRSDVITTNSQVINSFSKYV